MASVNSFETDMQKLRRKKKGKKLLRDVLLLAVIILAILVAFLTRNSWIGYFEGIFNRQMGNYSEDTSYLDISDKNNVVIGASDKFLAIFADTTFSTYNSSGAELLSMNLQYSNPAVEAIGTRALTYDLGGNSLCVVNSKEEVFSKKLSDQILFATLGKSGNVAVVTSTDKYSSFLTVYDKNGREIFRCADDNQLITAVALDDEGTGCLVSSTYVSGGTFKSVIQQYDFSKTEIVSKSPALETLVIDIEYTSNGGVWVVGDQSLIRLNPDRSVAYAYLYKYQISEYCLDKWVCALSFNGAYEHQSYVSVFDYGKETSTELNYNQDINCMYAKDGKVYLLTAESFYGINSVGTSLGEIELTQSSVSFAILSDRVYFKGLRNIDIEKISF